MLVQVDQMICVKIGSMEQLNPKAKNLFFIQNCLGCGVIVSFMVLMIGVPAIGTLLEESYDPLYAGYIIGVIIFLISIPVIIVPALSYFVSHYQYLAYKYELTDIAIKIEKGFIWKNYITIPYERIQSIDIYRGIFARMLNLSDLQIQTAGFSSTANSGISSEGRLPGLDPKVAEDLREKLTRIVSDKKKQGL